MFWNRARSSDCGQRTTCGTVVFLVCTLLPLQTSASSALSQDGLTVYDNTNNVTWLADGNLPASNRFTLPLCGASGTQPCVNANGSMNYAAAAAWVSAMNQANYLGHSDWQIPTTPPLDRGCTKTGPNGNSFGYGCTASALGSLYYKIIGLKAPNTAVTISGNTAGPFRNLQPYLYWSQTSAGSSGYNTFSFNTGWQGSNTVTHVMYVLPMIAGKLPGTSASAGQALQINAGGLTVYDPVANVTWLANANLASTNTFGLPLCQDPSSPAACVNQDGAMNWDSANQFLANMNASNGTGYLGQKNWEIPPVDPNCSGYNCASAANPMGELFYNQFGLSKGSSAIATPDVSTGAFHNLQPYLYWSCSGAKIQEPCETAGPVPNQEWSFSFGNGFEGTDVLQNDLFLTAYFVGTRASTGGPVVSEVANAEGENPTIAPNTWIEIKGVNLAPAGDVRTWQNSDFLGDRMPVQLDRVSATLNGKSAFVYYISPTQVNVLAPPDPLNGPVQVVITNNGVSSAGFTARGQPLSPSLFIFGGGPYVAATHANGSLIGPASLYPGFTTPTKPGETIILYGNGFGPTSTPVISGSTTQSGTLSALPVIEIGGIPAMVAFAGLNLTPGEFQFNVIVPPNTPGGDQPIVVTYGGASVQPGTLINVQRSAP